MKPTPEQVEAAKAFVRNCDTVEHRDILRDYMALGRMTPGVASQHILLAALEAAEADGARLDWLEAHKGLRPGNCDRDAQSYYILHIPSGYDYYKGGKNLPLREAIDAARKEART